MTAATVETTEQLHPFSTTQQYRELISPVLYNRLVGRIEKDEKMDRVLAERIMDSALGFLSLIATNPGNDYSPSDHVDIGWHTFILYTRDYAEFCQRVAGRFIHHDPSDEEGVEYGTGNIARTVAALEANGFAVDTMLWCTAACCSDGGSCSSSCGSH
ncbi:glycine-rich domain-containing protein [Streptomyces sp. cg40]|uniref:glycine-rich domain-containing protein n=1 Tax=Streptomyces sp. cg40 TaxID=3419764 RepID=UPI003D04786F